MKPWIKTSFIITALSASAVFSGIAMAGHGDHDGAQGWHSASPEQIKERFTRQTELRLAKLELALALAPEQGPAWADFKKTVTASTETVLQEISKHKAEPPKTALERLDRADAALQLRANLLADARKAVGALYVKLSEPQKTVFDAEAGQLLHFGAAHAGQAGHGGKVEGRGHSQAKKG
jgi:hypothetical protein